MLSNIPGVQNPESAMLRLVRESRDDQAAASDLVQRACDLLSSIRPSTVLASMQARLDLSRQVQGLRERSSFRHDLVDVIVQLHGDGPIYGAIRINNADVTRNLNTVDDASEKVKNKINHAIKLNHVHSELATVRNLVG